MKQQSEVFAWTDEFTSKLVATFGDRLVLVVHVGSWVRGDAMETSDIDLNIVLDRVDPEDVIIIRQIAQSMPDAYLACGFLGSRAEMALWPRTDLMAFYYGSRVLHGNLEETLGPYSKREILESAVMILSGISHTARHKLIFEEITPESVEELKGCVKMASMVIQGEHLLRTGEFIAKRSDLLNAVESMLDRQVLQYYESWQAEAASRAQNPHRVVGLLERWSVDMFYRLTWLADILE